MSSASVTRPAPQVARLEADLASAFEVEAAVVTASGSAALLAAVATCCRPGDEVLLPGWISLTVVNAVVLAGAVPVLVDVDADLGWSESSASEVLRTTTSLAVYAPFGGRWHDLPRWLSWVRSHGVRPLLDLVPCADSAAWRHAGSVGLAITSFGPRKPLGIGSGGAVLGDRAAMAAAATFLRGGFDGAGRKVGVGIRLPLDGDRCEAAAARLRHVRAAQDRLADATARVLATRAASLLPGWADTSGPLSKVPTVDGSGETLHPDATHRCPGWQAAVAARHPGRTAQGPLPVLDELYDRLRITRVAP